MLVVVVAAAATLRANMLAERGRLIPHNFTPTTCAHSIRFQRDAGLKQDRAATSGFSSFVWLTAAAKKQSDSPPPPVHQSPPAPRQASSTSSSLGQ